MKALTDAMKKSSFHVLKGKEMCKGFNLNEATAFSAAVHAAVLSHLSGHVIWKLQDFSLLDAISLSFGVEIVKDIVMILTDPRNSTVPIKKYRNSVQIK